MEKKLKDLLIELTPFTAPMKREYVGEYVEFVIGIGKDETATVTMSKEAFEKLKSTTLDYQEV